MWRCGGRSGLPKLVAVVSACLVLGRQLGWNEQAIIPLWRRAELSDGAPEAAAARCSALSIVCLADAPPSSEELDPDAALKALRSSPLHVVLAGHSRLRQVFEQLVPLLSARLRTRTDRPPPLADRDDPLAPPQSANSTCLATLRKPKLSQHVWCSQAADWGRVLLDFRWRHQTGHLSELLERLATRRPDRLIIGHGLYQELRPLQLRSDLQPLLARLRRLQQRGTAAVWMLEAGRNRYTALPLVSVNAPLVTNALLAELALEAGVPLWTAHLPLVQDWILRKCRAPPPTAGDGLSDCETQQLHTDPATARWMALQVVVALTELS